MDDATFQMTLLDVVSKVKTRLTTLEDRVAALEGAAKIANARRRVPTLYPVWQRIQQRVSAGGDAATVAKELHIPYTTARAYLDWTEEQVDKKRREWESYSPAKQAELLKKVSDA